MFFEQISVKFLVWKPNFDASILKKGLKNLLHSKEST